MSFVKEDYVLGNKKIVVGDNLHDLVLENLGRIYIRYGNSYKEFNELIKTLGKATSSKNFVIETDGLRPASSYGDGVLVYDVRAGVLYLSYGGELLELVEGIGDGETKFVRKTGDTMSGQLVINTKEAPLKVQSAELVKNLNANLLEGHDADEFAVKAKNEKITGNWTFAGENEFLKENTFQDTTQFNGTAVFNKNGDGAAIRVGTGDIITDGSMGSSMFASGMTGYGWRLNADTNTLEIDNLIVRGVLNVFELVVNKISATNGSLWVTDSFEIEKVHNLECINLQEFDNVRGMKEDTFYIPYIKDTTHVFSESSSVEDIKRVSKLTNYYQIQLDDSKYPFATRSIKSPKTGIIFSRFDFVFQIIDKLSFFAAFSQTPIVASNYYFEQYPTYGFYYDDKFLLRATNYGNSNSLSSAQHDELVANNSGVYFVWGNNYTLEPVTTPTENSELISKSLFENTILGRNEASYNITDMANTDIMLKLAANGIIHFTYLYQLDPKRINKFDTISGEDGKEDQITPQNPDFDKQTYNVVSANSVVLDDKDNFTFTDSNDLCKINLYYKYFGEEYNASAVGNSLYVVEAKNEQYPVFKPGDIIRCQKFTGTSVKQYNAIVLSLIGSYGFVIELQNHNILNAKTEFTYDETGKVVSSSYSYDTSLYERSSDLIDDIKETTSEESVQDVADSINTEENVEVDTVTKELVEEKTAGGPEKGDALVRIGSIFSGDRQRSMLLTSSEDNSPYQDIIVAVNRPDYGVIYFTPKYKTFEAYFDYDGTVRKGVFYLQNKLFKYIILIGDSLALGNSWEDITFEEAKEAIGSLEVWNSTYKSIYTRFRPYVVSQEVPITQNSEGEDDFTGVTKFVNGTLTFQVNNDSPIYFDNNGKRIKVTLQESFENTSDNISYFVSSREDRKVLTSFKYDGNQTLDYIPKGSTQYVTLTLGQIV